MLEKNQKEHTHPLTFGFLTPFYDLFVSLLGFKKNYYLKIASYLKPKPGDLILDVGTGTGNLALAIKEKFPKTQVTAVDPDEKVLTIAQKKARGKNLKIEFLNIPAQKLPFSSNHFDFVVSSLVIHHIPKPFKTKAFFEMKRVLKKDGTILIVDLGEPKNAFTNFISILLGLLEDVAPNRKGFIPKTMKEAGLIDVKEIKSSLGLISYYRGKN